jgi:hypothetical protein
MEAQEEVPHYSTLPDFLCTMGLEPCKAATKGVFGNGLASQSSMDPASRGYSRVPDGAERFKENLNVICINYLISYFYAEEMYTETSFVGGVIR